MTKTLQMPNQTDTSSAEWIAEAPSQCGQGASGCTPLPLTDFGTVQFSDATATSTDGHTGTISDPEWSAAAVTLSPGASGGRASVRQFASTSTDSTGGATPSSLSSDGSSFSVAWSDQSSSTGTSPTSVGSGSGYPYGYGGGDPYGGGGSNPYGDGGYGGGGWAIVVPGVGVVLVG